MTYFHESFICKEIIIENSNTSWDYLCVELSCLTILQIRKSICYVIGYHIILRQKSTYLLLNSLHFLRSPKRSNLSVFICGYFNINLLSINMNAHLADYFESVLATGFCPKISLPTRIQDNSHMLIDQIWSIWKILSLNQELL